MRPLDGLGEEVRRLEMASDLRMAKDVATICFEIANNKAPQGVYQMLCGEYPRTAVHRVDEVREIVQRVAEELGASGPRDMGRLMPELMKATGGRVEGRTLSTLARAELDRRAAAN